MSAVRLIAVEGNFGAGKSKYIDEYLMPTGATKVPEFALPTFLLDSASLGQAIYPLHDLLRLSAHQHQQGRPTVIERYIVSTLAFHYAGRTGLGEQIEYLYRHMLAHKLLIAPESTVVVQRPVEQCLEVVRARGWGCSLEFLQRHHDYLNSPMPPDLVGELHYVEH